MPTTCLCGSGKDINQCHGVQFDRQRIRQHIKYDILKIDPNNKVLISSNFKTQQFEKNHISCTVKFSKPFTPAGVIIYPYLLINGSKAIRPITIDGNHFVNDNWDVSQSVFCMLTPISRGTITFNMQTSKLIKNIYYEAECILECDGHPFSSVFALDYKDNLIKLFHHTTMGNRNLIIKSSCLKASKWNLQGTSELPYCHYIYFTDLELIDDPFDLLQIGMANYGTSVMLRTDDNLQTEEFTVYREETENRDSKVVVWVEPELLALNPLILHEPQSDSGNTFSWLEIFHPSIFRAPVRPGMHMTIKVIEGTEEFILVENKHFYPQEGFLAGHGMDMISMLRVLSESHSDDLPRKGAPTKADLGEIDPLWVSTWEKNLSAVSFAVLNNFQEGK